MTRLNFISALIAVLSVIGTSCDPESGLPECTITATVRDLSQLDGCGFVFELNDGKRLVPVFDIGWCGTPPVSEEVSRDPLYNFEFAEGKRVLLGYIERKDFQTACMAGEPVKITCLKEISSPGT